jgi:CHAD domain-containing protein
LGSISTHLAGATPPPDAAIHEIRKSVKKARAILRMVGDDKGSGLARSARRLHAINSRLSALRDADVMLETLHTLQTKDPGILNRRCFARVHRRLSSHRRSLLNAAGRKRTWQRIGQSVRKIRQAARHWKPEHRQFGCLAAGIRSAQARGRKAMERARKSQRATDFHEWRKQVKALWYQLRLVKSSGPGIRQDVKTLDRVEGWLGNEHNVIVLCDELAKDGSPEGDEQIDLDRVRLVGDRYRCELRTKALGSAEHIFARAPREYVKAVRREWKEWHSRQVRHGAE